MANSAATGEVQGPQGQQGTAGVAGATGAPGATGAAGANGLNADMTRTSTTSVTVGLGSKTFTYASSTNLGWLLGTRLRAASNATPTDYMEGVITVVSAISVTINVDTISGSGTHIDWDIAVNGNPGTVASRANIIYTTGTIAAGGFETGSLAIARSFAIIAVSVDRSSRVRLYSTAAQRTADITRGAFSPPPVNTSHGVIMDMVLDGSVTAPLSNFICSPEVYGANGDASPTSTIYYTITNNTVSNSTVQITLLTKIEEI